MVCSLSAATRRGDASAAAEPNSFVMVVCSTEIQRKFAEILNERWVYLHNRYHGAAYALDPDGINARIPRPCCPSVSNIHVFILKLKFIL